MSKQPHSRPPSVFTFSSSNPPRPVYVPRRRNSTAAAAAATPPLPAAPPTSLALAPATGTATATATAPGAIPTNRTEPTQTNKRQIEDEGTDEHEEDEEDEDGEDVDEEDDDDDDDDGVGAGSNSGFSSLAKKSRITQACDSCRRRKRKCDGTQPVCAACGKLGLACSYQTTVKKRGPQAGVVKRLRHEVKQLETELNREKRNAKLAKFPSLSDCITPQAQTGTNGEVAYDPTQDADGLTVLALNSAESSRVKNENYLTTYFTLLNNTMFPLLDEKSFYGELSKYRDDPSTPVPMSWNLRYAAALSVGSMIYGDVEYAQAAARVARHAASQLFDQPEAQVLRGMLVLSFYCLSTNQQSRAACYLAVANRMCCIVEVSPEIPPLATFLEDMTCSRNWWWAGIDVLPMGGFRKEQDASYYEDRIEYEKLIVTHSKRIAAVEQYELGNQPHAGRPPQVDFASRPATLPPLAGRTPAASIPIDAATGQPPIDMPLYEEDDATLRWELLKVMCFLAATRGEFNKVPSFSLYRSLSILTKALISPLTVGAVRTLILFFKVSCLALLAVTREDMRHCLHTATLATNAAQLHDCTHCPFYALCFNLIAQVHMRYAEMSDSDIEPLLVKDLEIVECVSRKWEFGVPLLHNLHARIVGHYANSNPNHPTLLALVEANPGRTIRVAAHAAAAEGNMRMEEAHAADAQFGERIRIPANFTATQPNHRAPSIGDTMSSLHQNFGSTLRVADGELANLAHLRKELTTGIHAAANGPGNQSMYAIANSAYACLVPPPQSRPLDPFALPPPPPPLPPAGQQFVRPGLDEVMQFEDEVVEEDIIPNEFFTHTLVTPTPSQMPINTHINPYHNNMPFHQLDYQPPDHINHPYQQHQYQHRQHQQAYPSQTHYQPQSHSQQQQQQQHGHPHLPPHQPLQPPQLSLSLQREAQLRQQLNALLQQQQQLNAMPYLPQQPQSQQQSHPHPQPQPQLHHQQSHPHPQQYQPMAEYNHSSAIRQPHSHSHPHPHSSASSTQPRSGPHHASSGQLVGGLPPHMPMPTPHQSMQNTQPLASTYDQYAPYAPQRHQRSDLNILSALRQHGGSSLPAAPSSYPMFDSAAGAVTHHPDDFSLRTYQPPSHTRVPNPNNGNMLIASNQTPHAQPQPHNMQLHERVRPH